MNNEVLGIENNGFYNHTTEQDVLCGLFDSKMVDDIICKLKPDYFHAAENRALFEEIKDMYDKNIPIDTTTVYDHLKRKGKADDIGGISKILGVYNATPLLVNIDSYIESLKKYYYRRRIYEAGRCLQAMSERSDDIDEAERIVMSIRDGDEQLGFVDKIEACGNVMTSFFRRQNNEEDPNKLITGYNFLDNTIGGFYAGQFIVIAARPCVGKSTIAINISKNIFRDAVNGPENKHVIFMSLEMLQEEVCKKIALCITGKSEEFYIQNPELSTEYLEALDVVSKSENLHIVCNGHVNVTCLKALARRVKHKHKRVDLIVVDYLQLMSGDNVKAATREREIANITRELKLMAKDFNVPVIALSQVNRSLDNRVLKIPKLSDLRESGAIEQDADKVFLAYNYLDAHRGSGMEEALKNIIIIDCAKNRQGKITPQYFYFNRPASKIRELDKVEEKAIAEVEEKEKDEPDW